MSEVSFKERREKFDKEHPDSYLLKMNKSERVAFRKAERQRINRERQLKTWALIYKAKRIDKKTYQQIADKVGLSRQRVEMIDRIIGKKRKE